MADPVDSRRGPLDRPTRWGQDAAAAPFATAAGAPLAPREVGGRLSAAAGGLAAAGAAAPIAVALAAATNALLWRPLVASSLIALLVLAPAGAGLVTALVGLRRVAALAQQAGGEAEQAVLRICVAALLFGYALLLPALGPLDQAADHCVPVAASELVLAWTLLLCVILWPAGPALRRLGAIVLDLLLFSAFLHFGGKQVAGWYPLYVVVTFYAGLRFGLGALLIAAATSGVGFAAVAISTASWREQPALAAGLVLALIVLPAILAAAIRRAAAARGDAASAEADRQHTLLAIARSLRGAAPMARASPPGAAQINDILDFAALETGTFVPPLETFELRALIRRALAPLQAEAAERGVVLRWRVDPRLPNRLRGHAQAVMRILSGLAEHAIGTMPTTAAAVRLAIDAAEHDADRVLLALRVDAGEDDGGLGPDGAPLALRLVQRLVALAGGSFAIDRASGRRARLAVTLPLTVEASMSGPVLDLDGRALLIVTEDVELAEALAEPLANWNAEPLWPADADQALLELAAPDQTKRAVVIIDGRDKLLSALGVAHQAATLGINAPFVLLIAEESQIASFLAVDEGEIDGFIPAPPSEALIANALDALPLAPERATQPPPSQTTAATARAASERRPAPAQSPRREPARVTPIAAHPKFAPPETAAAIDARALEGLRALGGGEGFLGEVIEAFRIDAGQIMRRIATAVAAADVPGFAHGLIALRRAAGHLGGVNLCALTASLQHLNAGELRQQGALYVQRLDAEIDRLTDALTVFAAAATDEGGAS